MSNGKTPEQWKIELLKEKVVFLDNRVEKLEIYVEKLGNALIDLVEEIIFIEQK